MTIEEMKKYGMFSIIGVVLILAIIGAFVPSARDYLGNLAKIILAIVPGIN